MLDRCGREIDYERISITDRCNLRCVYCMPERGVTCMRHEDVLSYEEIVRTVRALAALGIRHVRVTGGEPMARRGCLTLVERLHAIPGIETVSMTTNALLLDGCVAWAKEAGLSALNVSLDTLNPDAYRRMTRGGDVLPRAFGDRRGACARAAGEGQRRARARHERDRRIMRWAR